jgi:hypothetical protein
VTKPARSLKKEEYHLIDDDQGAQELWADQAVDDYDDDMAFKSEQKVPGP